MVAAGSAIAARLPHDSHAMQASAAASEMRRYAARQALDLPTPRSGEP